MFDHFPRWWDIGIDLVTGCTPVSPACEHCWSAEATHRKGGGNMPMMGCKNPQIKARYGGLTDYDGRFTGEVRPQWDFLDRIGSARKSQCYTFWNDLFHPGVEEEFVTSVLLRILSHPQHFYIICTKRPERALEYFRLIQPDLPNFPGSEQLQHYLMLMTTVENQAMADLRLPILLQIPGVLHGVSYEPALGPVDFSPWLPHKWQCNSCGYRTNGLIGNCKGYCQDSTGSSCDTKPCPQCGKYHYWTGSMTGLHWLITGGETGCHARPMHPDWPRQARDQAVAAGVPFFFKGWGEWTSKYPQGLSLTNRPETYQHGTHFYRVGKKAAGRLLDGRTWDEVPRI